MNRPKRRLIKALFGFTLGFMMTADDRRPSQSGPQLPLPDPAPINAESLASCPLERPDQLPCAEDGPRLDD